MLHLAVPALIELVLAQVAVGVNIEWRALRNFLLLYLDYSGKNHLFERRKASSLGRSELWFFPLYKSKKKF